MRLTVYMIKYFKQRQMMNDLWNIHRFLTHFRLKILWNWPRRFSEIHTRTYTDWRGMWGRFLQQADCNQTSPSMSSFSPVPTALNLKLCHLRYWVLVFLQKSSIFWDMVLHSPLKVNRRLEASWHLNIQARNKKTVWSNVVLRNVGWLQRTTRHCILEYRTLHNYHCEKLKFYSCFC